MKVYHNGAQECYPVYFVQSTSDDWYDQEVEMSQEDAEFCVLAMKNFKKAQDIIKDAIKRSI